MLDPSLPPLTAKGYVYLYVSNGRPQSFSVHNWKITGENWVFVQEVDFPVTVPAGFEWRKEAIAKVDEEIKRQMAEHQVRLQDLFEAKNQLLAIEMTPLEPVAPRPIPSSEMPDDIPF